ncbi:2OG-Fe(II) oxygenase [Bradyrhizobium ottawaense]|uniref:2OG-Fe(II) oxygenase n=1 Tax=Bradyrhizobium ottawaense TaxID=931866 RepID=UPI001BA4FCD1|nr:2OG-Fe(II) oxygenase [Bradyrhizobium ottawaense]
MTYPFAWWDNAFTDEELKKIIEYCDGQGLERAQVMGSEEIEDNGRRCEIKFHQRNDDTAWIYERMNAVIEGLNNQFYGFDLNGYGAFQYTSYNAAERGAYHWHMDICLGKASLPPGMVQPRKLSLTLLLNDDFEGGEFMVNLGNEAQAERVMTPKGRVVAFPSFILHSVKPVTKGIRKSIVIWVTGPKFR